MAQTPDYSLEAAIGGLVCGVDEVGRGPWAGPVVAAAVILDAAQIPGGIRDSKTLTPARRQRIAADLRRVALIGVGAASVAEIDRLNILAATMLAMQRAVAALPRPPRHALIDGNRAPDLPCPATPVVKGDARSLSIAAASILAKVTRDHLMARLARRYPAYGWDRNAGYGVPHHAGALSHYGITPHHRLSFAPVTRAKTQHVVLTD